MTYNYHDSEPFIKRLIYLPTDDRGQPWVFPIHAKASALEKMASRSDLYHKVAEFISGIKPDADSRYVLINALGSGDHWGPNKNGDFFPESALSHKGDKYGYQTFLKAGAYKHHINKDPSKSAGKVVLSEYNPQMHRVELIVKFAREKDPDVIEMIDAGQLFPVSMGCKVPSDFCYKCGHESKTVKDYCDDLNGVKSSMNEIDSEGKIACAVNLEPNFFDISRVLVPADRTARSYGKVASADSYPSWFFMPSGKVAEKLGDVKVADIEKQIVGVVNPSQQDKALTDFNRNSAALKNESSTGSSMAPEDLKKLSSFGMNETLSSTAALGIRLNPAEFQYMMLSGMAKDDVADTLYKLGYTFRQVDSYDKALDPHVQLDIKSINPQILKVARQYLDTKSVLQPYLLQRIMKPKTASRNFVEMDLPDLETISGLYAVYLDKLAAFGPEGLRRAEKFIPEVKFILASNNLTNPLDLGRNALESEKVAADEGSQVTIKDFVTGSLLSPKYQPSVEVVKNTDPSHWKLASALPELTPTRVSKLHPDTSAWVTVITVNSISSK